MAQKKDIKRQKERLEALKREAEQEKAKAKEAARERVLADFEKGQVGLTAVSAVTTSGAEVAGNKGSPYVQTSITLCFFFRARDKAEICIRFHGGGKARAGG